MKIEAIKLNIRQLTSGYEDNDDEGVRGYDGQLDIRPPFQREFIYKDKQRELVIDTIFKNYPLNVMYWAKREDGTFEVIDGQQRTISISQYVNGDFSYKNRYFNNLLDEEKEIVLNYELMVYVCSGSEVEKLEWFKTINIAGVTLNDQELRNAVYSGSWLSDAKKYFSKNSCPAYRLASEYMSGTPIRQDYLEKILHWISDDQIENYMAIHQHDINSSDLWDYFLTVIDWTKTNFTKHRREMKSVEWGILFNQYKNSILDSTFLEQEVHRLMEDEDVTNKKGIYSYVFTKNERDLSIRAFSDKQKRETYEKQKGVCLSCNKEFEIKEMDADHINPWSKGGKSISNNCQLLCKTCNRSKGNK